MAKPIQEGTCFKPCPRDCQLTQWSTWSSCQETCKDDSTDSGTFMRPPSTTSSSATTTTEDATGFTVIMNTQSRYRSVLQWPAHGGRDCPRLVDLRPCPLQHGSKCEPHFWKAEKWSKCLIPEGKTCGEGVRVRGLKCIQMGAKADMAECLKLEGLEIPKQHEECSVDCETDCVSGPWSAWSACSSGCPSSRSRSRPQGAKCKSTFVTQEEPCLCENYR